MTATPPLDITQLRRGCGHCSLHQLCLPGGIDGHELEQLDSIVRRKRPVERGGRLFRAGDPLEAVYVARDGAFKSVSLTEEGEEQILGFHLPGELIGLDALGAERHRCEAVALTTANVCEVPFDQLSDVAARVPGLQQQLMRVIGQSVGRDHDHLGMLVRRDADGRVALFLHSLGERYAHIGQPRDVFKLPMSREDIANYLGLAVETVSRTFGRLQEQGIIEVTGRRVAVVDRARLDRLAHQREAPEPAARSRRA